MSPMPSVIKAPGASFTPKHKKVQWGMAELSDGSTVTVDAFSHSGSLTDSASSHGEVQATWEEEELLAAHDIGQWGEHVKLAMVKPLHKAPRNNGAVDLMMSFQDGHFVAVKQIPTSWMKSCPQEFARCHSDSKERPWLDVGILRYLNQQSFKYSCTLEGIYTDPLSTYVVTAYADQGDLFDWAADSSPLGLEREERMRPIVSQIWSAVQWLHDHNIAHRDLCLENLLLVSSGATPTVKVIDFGQAMVGRRWSSGVYGGKGYQAPEMHTCLEYDSFLSDGFSVGVVIFALATHDYLWRSTKPGDCKHFCYAAKHGLRKFFTRRHVGKEGRMLSEVLSEEMVDLLEQLLTVDASQRATVGEHCFGRSRPSVWDSSWLNGPTVSYETEGVF